MRGPIDGVPDRRGSLRAGHGSIGDRDEGSRGEGRLVDAAPADANLVYFAFVNYTTLGYGDVIPAERWQLLGPMAAMNGILLFGWSTAVIFEILRRALTRMESLPASR